MFTMAPVLLVHATAGCCDAQAARDVYELSQRLASLKDIQYHRSDDFAASPRVQIRSPGDASAQFPTKSTMTRSLTIRTPLTEANHQQRTNNSINAEMDSQRCNKSKLSRKRLSVAIPSTITDETKLDSGCSGASLRPVQLDIPCLFLRS